jgi:release factor glutamine methyltransferase
VAIDICERALVVAKANAVALGVADRIDFRLGDRFGPLGGDGAFDAIMANPPYIATEQIDQLEPGVKDHEPRLALDGGLGGLAMASRLIEEAPAYLKPGGHLILEIGTAQEAPVRALIEAQLGLKLALTVHDHAKHPRVIRATRVDAS